MTARILDLSPDEYHQRPGLSSTIATTVVSRSALHGWTQHPCFGAQGKPVTREMDRGSIIHTLTLGAGKRIEVLPTTYTDAKGKVKELNDFRSDAAKELRDAAREAGKVPVLAEDFLAYTVAAGEIRDRLTARGLELTGRSELGIEWEEPSDFGPVLCRAMLDHAWIDAGRILDLKITDDAAPQRVERSAEYLGYAIQAHAYQRALAALRPELAGKTDFLFAFCEPAEPYAVNVCRPDGTFRELGDLRWRRAVNTWGRCLKENRWPGYDDVNLITASVWALEREEQAA